MTFRDIALTTAICTSLAGTAGIAVAQDRYDFDTLDADGNGEVTLAELESGIDTGVASEANPGTILEVQDTNEDGVISREEAGADGAIYTVAPEDSDENG